MEIGEQLEVGSPEDFGAWLAAHGGEAREIWVVIYKKASGKQRVTYEQLVETGLCHGWIDGVMKSLDAEKYAQRFTPRRKKSNWTETNRQLARRLIAEGRMTEAGRAALPEDLRHQLEAIGQ
jgi:uncharacterized protein YdeI (YjbR/CyaY-like superfamily)